MPGTWTNLLLFNFCNFFTLPRYLPALFQTQPLFRFKFLPCIIAFFFFSCATLIGFTAVIEIWGENFYLAEFAGGKPTEVSGPNILFQQFQYSWTRLYYENLQPLIPTIAILPIILRFKNIKNTKAFHIQNFRVWTKIWLSIFKLFVQLKDNSIHWLTAE